MALPVSVEQVIEALETCGDNSAFFAVFDTLPFGETPTDPKFTWATRDIVDGS